MARRTRAFFGLSFDLDQGRASSGTVLYAVMETYFSLIRRTPDGQFVGWIPDLPGVMAAGASEAETVYRLSRDGRQLLDKIVAKGLPLPAPSASDALPLGDRHGPYRRLVLVLG